MLAIIGAVLSIMLGFCALIGLASKFVLLPWLKEQLVEPVQETHKQVTVNSYQSDPLTLLDLVHLMDLRLKRVEKKMKVIEKKVDSNVSP